ncbi:pyrroline-5-carboxylate reductase [Oscillibacter valericigenes Sjm18-20]|nr:pyrroline-5-carboxylate reductase [Oscillibacter valericigenes Sjm18-20]
MKKAAIIGIGNIGSILTRRICLATPANEVAIFDRNPEKMAAVSKETQCLVAQDALQAAENAKYIVLAVKPQSLAAVLRCILPIIQPWQCIVSTSAGIELSSIEELLHDNNLQIPVARIMPNLPISIGKGCVLVSENAEFSQAQEAELFEMLGQCGVCQRVDEEHFDMGVSLSSCTPAYVFMFLEALADGGTALGYSRKESEIVAAHAVEGAVALFLEGGKNFGELKDAVCSPEGAAISGVAELERARFRGAIMDAVEKAYQKNESMKFELK